MRFSATEIPDVNILDIEYTPDERGFFARTWDETVCAQAGLSPSHMVQFSTSFNNLRGTIRGMHYQDVPFQEAKVVRCTRGSIYDVVIDLRKNSPTYTKWVSVELTADNHRAIFVPPGCAHGFQTLQDSSEVFYMMSEYFHPEAARGTRYDDLAWNIRWPLEPTRISAQDRSWPTWMI